LFVFFGKKPKLRSLSSELTDVDDRISNIVWRFLFFIRLRGP